MVGDAVRLRVNFMFRFLLHPPAWLFGGLVWLKNFCYDHGLLAVDHLDKPVISIGNLAMGGSGKTPVTIALAEMLLQAGYKVTILSRGYGRRKPKSSRQVSAEGDWSLYGDEPTMIKRRVPQACVCVGPSRVAAAAAAAGIPTDVYLLDDGFQHRRLARDLDIVLIDVTQPRPRLFPLNYFREGLPALKRANLVLLTRWDGKTDLSPWQTMVRRFNPLVPTNRVGFNPGAIKSFQGEPWPGLQQLRDMPLAAFCGIAQPQKFFDGLQKLNLKPVLTWVLSDHEPLAEVKRKALLEACRSEQVKHILTTEKDAVKLELLPVSDISWGFLSLETEWEEKQSIIDILTRSITIKVAHDEETAGTDECPIQGNGIRTEDDPAGRD